MSGRAQIDVAQLNTYAFWGRALTLPRCEVW